MDKRYQSKGMNAFHLRSHDATDTKKLKQPVVEADLNEEGSALDPAYDIPPSSQLWKQERNTQ